MNKRLNRKIIVAGVIALLFIWVCMGFTSVEWLRLYTWILLSGGIFVLVAVNVIILFAKNGENEMFEPKITKQEMLEFVKDNGMIMSWENINAMKVFKEDIVSIETVKARPVQLSDASKALEEMGYKVDGIDDGFISFNDGEENYKLCSDWIYRYQMNCIGIYKTYTVDQKDVEEMSRITAEITHNIRVVKLRMLSNDDRTRHGLEVSADSFYSDSASLNTTILALLDFINEAMSRLRKEMPQQREDDSTIDLNDFQQQMALNQNKTKYEC